MIVSCILPTRSRPRWFALAVQCWLRQEFPAHLRELVIVDDGPEPVGDLVPPMRRVRYVHLAGTNSIGAKLNLGIEMARGDVLCRWDDDDWHAPWRLQYQANLLERTGRDVCGADGMHFVDVATGAVWRYQANREYAIGGSLMFRRSYWHERPFEDVSIGEDNRFIDKRLGKRFACLPEHNCYVATIHGGNTCQRALGGREWTRLDTPPTDVVDAWWWSEVCQRLESD